MLIGIGVGVVATFASAAPTYNGTIDFFGSTGNHVGNAAVTCGVGIALNWGSTSDYTLTSNAYDCDYTAQLTCEDLGNVEVGPCAACGSWQYEQLYQEQLVDPCE
jgi:hypothetical protein